MFSLKVALYLGAIALIGMVILMYLDKFIGNSPNKNMIMITGVAVILNIMIFTFCVISFSKVKFQLGPQGPPGTRGLRGNPGKEAGLKVCGNAYLNAGENKMSILKKEAETRPRKPYIIED
jgi:hypothetical protein